MTINTFPHNTLPSGEQWPMKQISAAPPHAFNTHISSILRMKVEFSTGQYSAYIRFKTCTTGQSSVYIRFLDIQRFNTANPHFVQYIL